MGTGNLTELTDADTTGVDGDAHGHRLGARASPMSWSCRSARIAAAPWPRPIAARRHDVRGARGGSLPIGIGHGLLALHDRKPFPVTPAEIDDAGRR